MRTFRRFNWQMVVFCCVLMITTSLTIENAYGLHMDKTPSKGQTTVTAPLDRAISLKLPLLQPEFHWTFLSKQDFLAGKLVLSITRAGETTTITIFENGKISEGWEPLPIHNPKAGEIYFGFHSSKKYPTAPGDRLKIELQVKKDLDGIGPTETGILPAGTYTSEGTYSSLIDEFTISDTILKSVPKEKVADMRKMVAQLAQTFEFTAFLENWETQWPLKITGEEGWLSPEQRQQSEKLRKVMENQAKAGEEPELIPLFSVESLDGKEVQADDLKGKAVLVYYWNTHDWSCQQLFQVFDKIIQKYQGENIVFMAITDEPKETVSNFVQKYNYKMPVFLSKDEAVSKLPPTQPTGTPIPTPRALLMGKEKTKGIFTLSLDLGAMMEEKISENIQAYLEVSPIHDEAALGNVEKVKTLLEGNPGLVNAKDKNGWTPLHMAAQFGHKDIAEVLLTNKADVNARSNDGTTPLHLAVNYNQKNIAEVLLANGADVNAKDSYGWTPLHWTAGTNRKDLAEFLRQHGGVE